MVNKVVLEKTKAIVMTALSRELIDDIDVEVNGQVRFDYDEVFVRMVKELLKQNIGDRIIKHPTDWKEAFKEKWFPKWVLKKYPVKYRVYDALTIYPTLLKKYPVPPGLREEGFYFTFTENREDY